jgi:hypothetical protein
VTTPHSPDIETLKALRERVRAAGDDEHAGPDRELDAAIDVAMFGGETIWKTANYTMERYPASRRPSAAHLGGFVNDHVPLVTSSVDAALALIPKGWALSDMHDEHFGPPGEVEADGAYCALTNGTWDDVAEGASDASVGFRSLAIVAAAIAARIIDAGGEIARGE